MTTHAHTKKHTSNLSVLGHSKSHTYLCTCLCTRAPHTGTRTCRPACTYMRRHTLTLSRGPQLSSGHEGHTDHKTRAWTARRERPSMRTGVRVPRGQPPGRTPRELFAEGSASSRSPEGSGALCGARPASRAPSGCRAGRRREPRHQRAPRQARQAPREPRDPPSRSAHPAPSWARTVAAIAAAAASSSGSSSSSSWGQADKVDFGHRVGPAVSGL